MPYINDRLAEQEAQRNIRQYRESPVRQSRFYFDPNAVMALLRGRIRGQGPALSAIDDMLQVVKADIGPGLRPLAVLLLMGPTGVGKTETARLIAEGIHGNADALCRIDMNTLAQEHYAAALTGAPPGYVGSKEGQSLFDGEKIKGSFARPGVVLFDELEKADNQVVRALMNVLDSGRLVLASGAKVLDFSNSIILMSSNIGAADIAKRRGVRYLLPANETRLARRALESRFDPEFINRIDYIVAYQRLAGTALIEVLDVELDKFHRQLGRRGVTLEIDSHCHDLLLERVDRRYGARDIARRIRRLLAPQVARAMLMSPDRNRFVAICQDGQISVAAQA
ncbi:AAA family ATPase [Spongiibacter taiwanensis]|uniref:ATP-dependent Clp protease ATP-binding subunit n=1 Tax=Spongiibacter taiwanensis TaxID=1748242 RepID=UPI002035F9B6|nr:AAA family ATPase [Spongiibacter taiwanensis]USA42169.1 AAA family ATPase [Spongiibacter taiwanensis]